MWKLTSEKMALKMFRVEVRLNTMRARELPIRVFGGDLGVLARAWASGRDSRATRSTGKDTPSALGANNVCGNLFMWRALLPVWRSHAPLHLLMHWVLAVQWCRWVHRPQWHQTVMSWSRRGRNCLRVRMRHRHRALRHHSRRVAAVWLNWLLVRGIGLEVVLARSRLAAHLLEAPIARRSRCVWLGRGRSVRRAQRLPIHGVHRQRGMLSLQRRKRLRWQRRVLLQLLWGYRRQRRVYRRGRRRKVAARRLVVVVVAAAIGILIHDRRCTWKRSPFDVSFVGE